MFNFKSKSEKNMINILIIEDEESFSDSLKMMIECTNYDVRVLGVVDNVQDAVKSVNMVKPDLIFLDVMLPDGNGFEVLEKTKYKDYSVVFTTSYTDYAVKAFELSALHYLIKPISVEKVNEVFQRYSLIRGAEQTKEQFQIAKNILNNNYEKILLRVNNYNVIYNLKDIVLIESESSYSKFYLTDKTVLTITRPLNYYENLLSDSGFIRIHNRYIINSEHVKSVYKGNPNKVTMSNGLLITVAQNKSVEFNRKFYKNIKI